MTLNICTPGRSGPNMVSSPILVFRADFVVALSCLYPNKKNSVLCPLGISAETHQMLEQALCLNELHDAADHIFITPVFLLLLPVMFLALLS